MFMVSKQRVDEWREHRALGQYQQAPHQNHHDDDRQKPELFSSFEKRPEFTDEIHDRLLKTDF
jgi:hypothetical protein